MTKPPPKPKPAVEVPAPPAPVVGPLDKFLIKKEDGPKFIKPKSETSVQPEDEGEPPICYDWRELVSPMDSVSPASAVLTTRLA